MVRIPSEYQEVEYLESTGTQYIDTGIYPQLNDAVEITFYSDTVGDRLRPFGAYVPGVAIDGYQGLRIWTAINSNKQVDNTIYGKINNIKCLSDGTWILNDEVVLTDCPINANDRTAITIFKARYANGSLYGNADMKLYDFTYKRNGAPIQNLIPCYRKSDNEPGMYDTVSKTFFTNSGTGTFLVGNDVNYSNTNLLEVRRRILLNTPHIESMSGNPAIFSTDMSRDLKECKIRFTPVQAGEGTPSPENVRAISGWDGVTINFLGKRLTPEDNPNNPNANYTSNSSRKVVYDTEEEAFTSSESGVGVIYTNHYKTGSSINGRLFVAPFDTTITLSFDYKHYGKSTVGNQWPIRITGAISTNIIAPDEPTGWVHFEQTVNIKQGSTILICFYTGVFWKNLQVISGDSVANDIPYTKTSISIPFPQTIYGGYVDLIKGEVVEEWTNVIADKDKTGLNAVKTSTVWAQLSLDTFGVANANLVSNMFTGNTYSPVWGSKLSATGNRIIFALPTEYNTSDKIKEFVENNSTQFVYPLATPNVYTLTPQSIKALKGLNNLYSDANGNIEVKFWKH